MRYTNRRILYFTLLKTSLLALASRATWGNNIAIIQVHIVLWCLISFFGVVYKMVYSLSQKNPPCGFLTIFSKRMGIF